MNYNMFVKLYIIYFYETSLVPRYLPETDLNEQNEEENNPLLLDLRHILQVKIVDIINYNTTADKIININFPPFGGQ